MKGLTEMHGSKLFATAAILACLLLLTASAGAGQPAELMGYTLQAENEYLQLWFNQSSAEFAVVDKAAETVWYSNPADLDTAEKIARGSAKEAMRSQLEITYYAPGDKRLIMDSFNDSVKYGQFVTENLPNGLRVVYTLGQRWKEEDYLPIMISKERFEKLILAKVSYPDDRQLLEQNYELISLEKLQPGEKRISAHNIDTEKLFGPYTLRSLEEDDGEEDSDDFFLFAPPELSETDLINLLVNQLLAHRVDLNVRFDIASKDVEQLKENPTYIIRDDVANWDRKDMIEIIRAAGYRPEDVQIDHRENHLDPPRPNQKVFTIPVEYRLIGRELVVRIPVGEIEYPTNVLDQWGHKTSYPLHSIELLRHFAAAGVEDTGYMFVPDGSGGLIHLNNGKLNAVPYEQSVYGPDHSLMLQTEQLSILEQAHLPVFGLKNGEKAMLAVIEEGDALASIKADIAGRTNSYNMVWAKFTTVPKGTVVLHGFNEEEQDETTEMNAYQSRLYQGDIVVRYQFLYGEEADYVGMAARYREHLKEQGLKRVSDTENSPFYLELVGAIDKKGVVMGAPRLIIEPLTTFAQAREIVNALVDSGVQDVKLRYSGCLTGGLRHEVASSAGLEPALGTRDEFANLITHLQAEGVELYLDANFLNVYKDGWFDGFRPGNDAARFLDGDVAKIYDYNIATYQYEPGKFTYVLSPTRLERVLDGFLARAQNWKLTGLSLQAMGRQVNADYRKDPERTVDRHQAREAITAGLKTISEAGLHIMAAGGNAPVLPVADHLVELPLGSSEFNIIDEDVPFLPIVLHGYAGYSGQALNFEQSDRKGLLKVLETGACPYYKWTYRPSSVVKGTDLDELYSTHYRDWLEEAVEVYRELSKVLGVVHDEVIVEHARLAPDVFLTVYESGRGVIVNYNEEPVKVQGMQIPALGYRVIQGGM